MKKILNKKTLGILISFIFITAIISQIDVEKTINSFSKMNPLLILPVIPIYLSSFAFRTFRWKVFLNEKNIRFTSLLSSIFVGFSLNCLLPARAGEIYRAYSFSKRENLAKTKVFTSIVLERFFDGVLLFSILLTTIYFVHRSVLFLKIALAAGVIFIGGFIFLLILANLQKTGSKREKLKCYLQKILNKRAELIEKFFSVIDSFFEGLKSLNCHKLTTKALGFTLFIWLMEGSSVFFVTQSFDVEITYIGAFLVLSVTAFSSLIPAGPAAIGPYQWGYIIALAAFGVETELAFAISIVNQFIAIALILSGGLFFMWKDHIKIGAETFNAPFPEN